MQQERLSIDVEKVLHSKNPALARLLPGFVVSWLKRIVHQTEINAFLAEKGHLRDHDFVAACFAEMGATAQVEGLENIPREGGCVVASNHPLGGLDGIGLMKVVGQHRRDIRFFVNDILLNLVSFGDLFVGVNKHGKNPKEALRQMDEVFASDQCVLFFPAGLVSRRQPDGSIQDLEWQKSFIAKAVRYQKPIIPTFIGGHNSSFFYNLSYWRKRLGIKANIEMLFLVDEIYRQRGNTLRFIFGPPIPPETFTKDRTHAEWAQALKDYVYRLGNGEKKAFGE